MQVIIIRYYYNLISHCQCLSHLVYKAKWKGPNLAVRDDVKYLTDLVRMIDRNIYGV